jgi:hypothetical protein
MGQFGIIAMSRYTEHMRKGRLKMPITDEEFEFAATKNPVDGIYKLSKTNFLLLQILRMGRTSKDQLRRITAIFGKADKEGKGYISFPKLEPRAVEEIEMTSI